MLEVSLHFGWPVSMLIFLLPSSRPFAVGR